MSKIIVISSDQDLISSAAEFAGKKSCSLECYTEQDWKRKTRPVENDNVINIKSMKKEVTLPSGKLTLKTLKPLGEVQMDTIRQALYSMNGNVSRVSKALNIGRATLYRKIKDHDVDLSDIRNPRTEDPVKLPIAS